MDRLKGAEQPKNTARRMARQMRRQTWRRWRRKRALLRALVDAQLLPQPETSLTTAEQVEAYLAAVDARIRPKWTTTHLDQQRWIYALREAAATGDVERFELGRALYQLGQRRGFKSNRRADARSKDDEKSIVKAQIGELQEAIDKHPVPTLGAYLASLDPDQTRLRGRWTSRAMFENEFETIWTKQASRYDLNETDCSKIRRALFWQRPLKSQSHTIGRCSLIPTEPRAPIASRQFQRFRLLQSVNHLTVSAPDEPTRSLSHEERSALIDALNTKGDLTVMQAKKCMGLRPKLSRLNIEDDGDKKIIGNRTEAKLREIFGTRFDRLSAEERDEIVIDLRSIRLLETLKRRGESRWTLSAEQAAAFADVTLEEGYGGLSLAAIDLLLPLLEDGMPYATARRRMFPESFKSTDAVDELPPVLEAINDLRNPGVTRSLSETRKVVNQLIREYGKPERVRIELARDLKNGPSRREQIHKLNVKRSKERESVADRITREAGISNPSSDDIERVLLADECGWRCPYTGKSISMGSLLGPSPQFDVEHIWPRSRSMDDSFVNKTLCYHEENRSRKRGRTPFEAYGSDRQVWNAMIQRVSEFKGDQRTLRSKFERFIAEDISADFTNRHLSDTRYIARLTADYLGLLYGGRADASGKQRVDVRSGGLTAWLRTGWGLTGVLGDTATKNRDDHRHHAVDAVVVALTDQRAVQLLARAAQSAEKHGSRRAFDHVDEPFEELRDQVKHITDSMLVSHQQSRKVSGALHKATIYGKQREGKHRVRKELDKLSPSEIAEGRIVDKRALEAIRSKLEELGKPNATAQQIGQIFGDPMNRPLVKGANGSMVRLRKVRVDVDDKPIRIGQGNSTRFVNPGSNHHTEVWEIPDGKGGIRWEHEPVTMFEAYRRKAAGEPVISRTREDGARFVFSLSKGEHVLMEHPKTPGQRQVFRVLSISRGDIEVIPPHDGRPSTERKSERIRVTGAGDRLRTLGAEKILVTYLGECRRASD